MKNTPGDIKYASKLLKKHQYSRVISFLEPKIPLYLEHKGFYSLLAIAFFYTGDLAGAKLYFERGQKVEWNVESALYLAVIYLKRRDINSALRTWLDILDEEPGNRYAKKGLAILKKITLPPDLEAFLYSKEMKKLLPKQLPAFPFKILFSVLGVAALVFFTIYFAGDRIRDFFNKPQIPAVERELSSGFNLDEFDRELLEFSGEYIYEFNGNEIENLFKEAYDAFNEHRDNQVRQYLNMIIYSNARSVVKEKAELLAGYLQDPDFKNYSDEIKVIDINSDVYRYNNCIIKWKGMISNLSVKDGRIEFNLLAGYENKKVVEGFIPVELDFPVKLSEDLAIELLARVKVKEDGSYYLSGITLRQFKPGE